MSDFLYIDINKMKPWRDYMKNFEKANKTKICKKYIDEINKVVELMNYLKMYCEHVVSEESCGGYRGDGANDPDNRPKKIILSSDQIYKFYVKPASKEVGNNDFIRMDYVSELLWEILNDCENIVFPEGFFQSTSQPKANQNYEKKKKLKLEQEEDWEHYPWLSDKEQADEKEAFMAFSKFLRIIMNMRG